jgi:hypothetical protein
MYIPITVFDSFLPMQTYSGSFIRKNPMMFVDTAWVNIKDLKEFLEREREVSVYTKDIILVF